MGDKLSVHLINQQSIIKVDAKGLTALLDRVLADELDPDLRINLLITTDERIAELNRTFLQHEGPTDVLAFPIDEQSATDDEPVFGEVVVSAETARRVAPQHNTTPERELTRYALHGLLHLAGFDDRTPADRKRMHDRQENILKEHFA